MKNVITISQLIKVLKEQEKNGKGNYAVMVYDYFKDTYDHAYNINLDDKSKEFRII